MLVAMAMDRYLHVTKLNNYNKYMNHTRGVILIAISFVLSICYTLASATPESFLFETKVINAVFDASIIRTI